MEKEILNQQSQSDEAPTAVSLSILCVDDEENILKSLTRLFREEPFKVLTATSGKEGLDILQRTAGIGLIISDQRMPEMVGTDFLQQAVPLAPDASRMILTGYADMNAAISAINDGGAQRFLVKPWNEQELLLAVRDGLQRYHLIMENQRLKKELEEWNASLKQRVLQQTATIRKQLEEVRRLNSQESTPVRTADTDTEKNPVSDSGAEQEKNCADTFIPLLASVLDKRHRGLSKHSRRVAALVKSMLSVQLLPEPELQEIHHAALLHDIGMVGLADRILAKQKDNLSGEELMEYQLHPVKGQEIVDTIDELKGIGRIIRHHHEHYDGTGFPDKLSGQQIPLGARIIYIATYIDNAYAQMSGVDAKYQLTKKVAAGMGTLFDPGLADAANLAIREGLADLPAQRGPAEQEITLKDLKIGMILTRDIYNSNGELVLERGAVAPEGIKALQAHHIPLTNVTYVERSSGRK